MKTEDRILESLEEILARIKRIDDEIVPFKRACEILDLSPSAVYGLTASGELPHFKPNGKRIYFRVQDLHAWMTRFRRASNDELGEMSAGGRNA